MLSFGLVTAFLVALILWLREYRARKRVESINGILSEAVGWFREVLEQAVGDPSLQPESTPKSVHLTKYVCAFFQLARKAGVGSSQLLKCAIVLGMSFGEQEWERLEQMLIERPDEFKTMLGKVLMAWAGRRVST